MSARELAEHLGYLTDQVKLEAYAAAFDCLIKPDTVVLDLGAGTGVLGLLAAQRGARRVYAVDGGPVLRIAKGVAERCGFVDRIVHVSGFSTELVLPEQVDLVVCDQIGGFVHDAGILRYYADAVDRLLKPGGVLVPSGFVLRLTPVDDRRLAGIVRDWLPSPAGLDMTPFAEAATNTEHYVEASADAALGPDVPAAEIASNHDAHFGGSAELPIERAGRVCGLLGTFVAQMSPSVTMTNAPWAPEPMKRWQNFYPFAEPVDVSPGDRIQASIDVSPRTSMVAWRGTIVRADGTTGPSFSHDTLRGRFEGPDSIIKASDMWAPPVTGRLPLARAALDLVDGSHSIQHIADALYEGHRDQFVSAAHARSFVRAVIGPVEAD